MRLQLVKIGTILFLALFMTIALSLLTVVSSIPAQVLAGLIFMEHVSLIVVLMRKSNKEFVQQRDYEIRNISLVKRNFDLRILSKSMLLALDRVCQGNPEAQEVIDVYKRALAVKSGVDDEEKQDHEALV